MAKKHAPPLTLEIIKDRGNLFFLSLLEFKRESYLTIIDNVTPTEVGAFVLDYAQQEGINLKSLLSVATHWFYKSAGTYPFSIELARLGLTEGVTPIYRTFSTCYVSRIVGNAFTYNMSGKVKVKRRRVSHVPDNVEIVFRRPLQTA